MASLNEASPIKQTNSTRPSQTVRITTRPTCASNERRYSARIMARPLLQFIGTNGTRQQNGLVSAILKGPSGKSLSAGQSVVSLSPVRGDLRVAMQECGAGRYDSRWTFGRGAAKL